MKVFTFICVHAWETNTHARVNLYEMSTYKSWFLNSQHACACWHMVARGIVFEIVHFPWPNELTICPYINGFQIPLKTSCTRHRWHKAKDLLVFCSGKICLVLYQGCCSFVLLHLCPVHKVNAQAPITTILTTHLLHEFIVNVKHRMNWSYRKPYICLSLNFWKQYPADGICLTSVNMQKYVTSLWLLWKSPIFPDLHWNSLTW